MLEVFDIMTLAETVPRVGSIFDLWVRRGKMCFLVNSQDKNILQYWVYHEDMERFKSRVVSFMYEAYLGVFQFSRAILVFELGAGHYYIFQEQFRNKCLLAT